MKKIALDIIDTISSNYNPNMNSVGGVKTLSALNFITVVGVVLWFVITFAAFVLFMLPRDNIPSFLLQSLIDISSFAIVVGFLIMLLPMIVIVISVYLFFRLGSKSFKARSKNKLESAGHLLHFESADLEVARKICMQEIVLRDTFFKWVFKVVAYITTIFSIFATVCVAVGNENFLGLNKSDLEYFISYLFLPAVIFFIFSSVMLWLVWNKSRTVYTGAIEIIDIVLAGRH